MGRSGLPQPLLDRIAEQFRALGEPVRLRLLNRLFDGEATVGELAAAIGSSVANVSRHLGVLFQAGWVTRRKDGVAVVYAVGDERALHLCELMCERVRDRVAAEAELVARPARRGRS